MKFTQKLSFMCAKWLQTSLNENHERRNTYYYSFQILFGETSKLILLILVSILFRVFYPTMIISIIFALYRLQAGGIHMDTNGMCMAVTLTLFTLCGIISERYPWTLLSALCIAIVAFLYGLYAVILYSPRENKNRRIENKDERLTFRKRSFMFLYICFPIILLITLVANSYTISVAASLGIILESFSLTNLGHRFFNRISGQEKLL